jgi:hypothetical protein
MIAECDCKTDLQNNVIVLLLNAGDKSRQSKDIELAKKYLENSKGKKCLILIII